MPEEARKEIAAGEGEPFYQRGFDPYNYIIQQLNNMDGRFENRFDKLDNKIDSHINVLRQEMLQGFNTFQQENKSLRQEMLQGFNTLQQENKSLTRWAIGTIIAVIMSSVGIIVSLRW